MVATSEVVVLVTSQRWNWDGCATHHRHQRAAICGHAHKWHDERDEGGLARMAEGAATEGWSALDGAVCVCSGLALQGQPQHPTGEEVIRCAGIVVPDSLC